MAVEEHALRARVIAKSQHPLRHAADEVVFATETVPGITSVGTALRYLFAVLYPQALAAVATPGDLPAVGNSINDYRVVTDDGDGNAAGYRWFQREGAASASWNKVYDMDWGVDSVMGALLNRTQDLYTFKYGYDDLDEAGVALAGVDAGQHLYGGRAANTHLTLHANAGDGVGAQTGYVQFADNVRPQVDSAWSLGTTTERWLKVWTDELQVGTLNVSSAGTITDSDGLISFGSTDLTTSGSVTAGSALQIAAGLITDVSGAISFSDENLSGTGNLSFNKVTATGAASAFAAGTTFGADLTLGVGSITSASGAISFGDENLSTTGNFVAAFATFARLDVDNLRLDGNTLSSTDVNGDINLTPNGSGYVRGTKFAFTDSGQVLGNMYLGNSWYLDPSAVTPAIYPVNGVMTPLFDIAFTTTRFANIKPDGDNTRNSGTALARWAKLYLAGAISDGTDEVTAATLVSLRDINAGVSSGMSLFYDGSKWVASVPDTEVDHGSISGLGDDDHAQYALLAGRAGGQTLYGGTLASESLILHSTAHATKGTVEWAGTLQPLSDDSYDLGASAKRVKDVYSSGQFVGLRAQNVTTAGRPSAAVASKGRLVYDTDLEDLFLDRGGSWLKVSIDRMEIVDTVTWDNVATTKTYTVDGSASSGGGITYTGRTTDPRVCVWALKRNGDNYKQMGVEIDHPSATEVRVTVGVALPAGTYTLIGVG